MLLYKKMTTNHWFQFGNNFFRQEFLKSYFKKVEVLEFKDWNGRLFIGHFDQLPKECKDALVITIRFVTICHDR